MGVRNYYSDSGRRLSFQWGALRELVYSRGDTLDWSYYNRPPECDDILQIPAYDDSISDLESGYYLIEISNDVFLDAYYCSFDEYTHQLKILSALPGLGEGGNAP